jgi:hypothetical protein
MSDNPIDEAVRAQAAAWFAEYDKNNHFPEMLALDAYAAGHAAAQQQGQAVAVDLMRDAERYRFIAADHSAAWEEELDAAIDAAMREAKP